MTPARKPAREEPTVGQMFQRMLDRDEIAAKAQQYQAEQIVNLNSVALALQSELQRLVKLAERQDGINERQVALAEKTAEHAKTFDRAFGEIEKHKTDFSKAVDKLGDRLETFGEAVTGYRGSIGALRWVVGLTLPLGIGLIALVYAGLKNEIQDARGDAAASISILETTSVRERARIEAQHDRDVKDLDARADALEAR